MSVHVPLRAIGDLINAQAMMQMRFAFWANHQVQFEHHTTRRNGHDPGLLDLDAILFEHLLHSTRSEF